MSTEASDEAAVRIAHFIVTQLDYPGPVTDFTGSQPVRLTEAIDSAALLEVATFVENAFSVQIQDNEFRPENFATIADLVRLLRDKGALTAPLPTGADDRKHGHS